MSVEQKVKQIIVEQLGVDESQVDSTASFVDDLGADSLDIVELVMAFEEAFDLDIPDEDAEKITTVKDAVDYIEDKTARSSRLGSDRGESVLSRRVVVTGVGLLSLAGHRHRRVLGGHPRRPRAASRRITQFDAAAFTCRLPAKSRTSIPGNYIEKKEIKKMGRFIQFAIAAADFAMQDSGLKVTPEIAERVGVYIGSGIGGFEVIEREHQNLLEQGPRPHFALLHSGHHHQSGVGLRVDPHRRQGPELGHRDRLHHQRALHRRFLPHHPARRRRRHDLRRHRSLHHADGHRRVRRHARALHAQRRARAAPPARGTRIATDSWSAKARASWCSKNWNSPSARGAHDPGRNRRLRHERATPIHITAPSEDGDGAFRVMRNALDDAGTRARTDRLHQRARHFDAMWATRLETIGDQALLRRPRLQGGGQFHQVHDRPPARRRRRARSRHHGAGDPRSDRSADHQPRDARIRSATWTTCPTRRGR